MLLRSTYARGLLAVVLLCLAQPAWGQNGRGSGADAARLGTGIHWAASPNDAARQAAKERKLVFVIHVSGNFADQTFT